MKRRVKYLAQGHKEPAKLKQTEIILIDSHLNVGPFGSQSNVLTSLPHPPLSWKIYVPSFLLKKVFKCVLLAFKVNLFWKKLPCTHPKDETQVLLKDKKK